MNKLHLGVYGLIVKGNKILLVKKSRGPYAGKLALPGGRAEHGETVNQALSREIIEETGIKIDKYKLFDNYTLVVDFTDDRGEISMYHVGLIYLIESFDDSKLVKEMDFEDSLGSDWYEISKLKKDQLSPFAFKAVSALQNGDA
ncbi:NUDIX domain-containing protein [Patescibacteria group bacterium]|nr:NUDIX domain-containing protein [Patescibacteria group bacterium]